MLFDRLEGFIYSEVKSIQHVLSKYLLEQRQTEAANNLELQFPYLSRNTTDSHTQSLTAPPTDFMYDNSESPDELLQRVLSHLHPQDHDEQDAENQEQRRHAALLLRREGF